MSNRKLASRNFRKGAKGTYCEVKEDGSVFCELNPENAEVVSFFDFKLTEDHPKRRVVHIEKHTPLKSSALREAREQAKRHQASILTEIKTKKLEEEVL